MQHKRYGFLVALVGFMIIFGARAAASTNGSSGRGPGLCWFMMEARLDSGELQPDMLFWENRSYTVEVDVSVEFHYQNDDGSRGEFIGSTNEGTSRQTIPFSQADNHASDLGERLAYTASGMAGQEVGYQVSQRVVNAARTAASQANPLQPSFQWGNWIADTAAAGRNFLGRLVGAAGGVF
jgi:hypothetical protein